MEERVLLSGSHGLIGSALKSQLIDAGAEFVPLVRSERQSGLLWEPVRGVRDSRRLGEFTAVVHLAGASIASGRWTAEKKREILLSRVQSTRRLVEQLHQSCPRPKTLICASAVGIYGDRGDSVLTEAAALGEGFLADVCREWEATALAAAQSGMRVVHARFGMVLAREGGALKKLLVPFRLGLGGPIGSGRQYWSWIALPDAASALVHLLRRPSIQGAVNVTAPNPLPQREFARILAHQLHRPARFPLPAPVARLLLGEMADALLLSSCRAVPEKLQQSGFQFQYPELTGALGALSL
jgi:uncharacterized protein